MCNASRRASTCTDSNCKSDNLSWTVWVLRTVSALLPIQIGRTSHTKKLFENSPIARNLLQEKMNYPLTIVYIPLRLCGFAYMIFEHILGTEQG